MAQEGWSFPLVFSAGLLLGSLLGLLLGRLRVRRELQELRSRVRDLEAAVEEAQTSSKQLPFGKTKRVEFGSMGVENTMLNEALSHMWPYLADIAKSLLFEMVEPKLQDRLPKALSGISFSRTRCSFGSTPLRIRKLSAAATQEGSWKNVTFTTELVHDGDCKLELVLPSVGRRLLGSCAPLPPNVGVSEVKFRGTLVIELTNLVPRVPLVSGVRVYFINPPMLDLTMTGGFSGVLNAAVVKQNIIEAVSHSFAQHCVLPRRHVLRFAKDINIFKLKAPQPEGMLRLELVDINGQAVQKGGGNLYVTLIFGDSTWETVHRCSGAGQTRRTFVFPTNEASAETVVDLTVHNRSVQTLCIQVYAEEQTRLWGAVRGQLLGQSWVPCESLIEDTDAWWPLVMRTPGGNQTSRFEGRYSVINPQDASCHERTQAEVHLRTEWRPFTTAMPECLDGAPTDAFSDNGWRLCKEVGGHVSCLLLVGVRSASNLPLEHARYWCLAESSATVVPIMATKKGNRKHKVTQTVRGKSMSETGSNVEAIWDRPLLFHLEDPREAMLDLAVWKGARSKRMASSAYGSCVGSLSYPIGKLLHREGLKEALREPLQPPRPLSPGKTTGPSLPLCELAEEASRAGEDVPHLQVELQLWLLQAPQPPEDCSERSSEAGLP